MTVGVVTVGRRQYVSGLYWENSPGGSISQAAKEAARQPGTEAEFYATRSGNKQGRVPQFGLLISGNASLGLRAGMPSIAGCLANQQPGSWIGAFRLREGTALVIMRDDLIVPDGDLFFVDESEARDHLYKEMAVGGFQRIYAPEAWGVPGADSMPVTLLLNDRADVKLRNFSLTKQTKALLAIGLVLLLAILGIGWYVQYQEAQEEEMRRQQMAAIEKMKAQAKGLLPGGQRPEYPKPVPQWEHEPRPMEVVAACQQAFEKVKIGVAGWDIVSMSCSPGSLSIRWKRLSGISSLPAGSIVTDTGETATSSVTLDQLTPRGIEKLVDPDFVTRRYLRQNWPGSIRREPDDPPPPPPPGYKGEWNPPPPPWVKRSFTFNVPVLPWILPELIADVPGVVIRSMAIQGAGASARDSWTIQGVIYENRR